MKRLPRILWPVLVAVLSLALTAWLSLHERQTQDRHLKDNFDFGLRQTATRIEQRMTSYEQTLRGARGLFEVSDRVAPADFTAYVDAQLAGPDFAGLRTIDFVPAQDAGADIAERNAAKRAAMLQSRDSGGAAITDVLQLGDASGGEQVRSVLMFMPVYAKGKRHDNVAERRAHLSGWVVANFRIADLMSSLYGEGTPGLDVRIHDGVDVGPSTLIYASADASAASTPARFDAQEFISFAGHTWTLVVRSTPEFERRYSNDAARVIAIAGSGLSLLLALSTWLVVTARVRAVDAARLMTRQLREGAEQYRRIVETANEGIWSIDAAGRTTFVNPKMQQLLGYSADEMLGRRWIDFMERDDAMALMREADEQQRPGSLAQLSDARFRRKDGSDLWASMSTSPIVDVRGERAGVLAMVTDVTDRKAVEANRATLELQLRQSQKMEAIGTLAGGIAHDFNNILAAILGNVSMVEQDLGVAHPSRGRLEQIGKAGVRARNLVQQIVAFSRQQPREMTDQALRPLIDETAELLRSTLPALVKIEVRASGEPLQISGDATQLQQVLMNLCTNSWHALQGGTGRIVIGLEPVTLDADAATELGGLLPGPHAHVWVTDDGVGMDEATRLRVFEPFFTTKVVGLGTGLGLSVAHGIVVAHRGAITVRSVPNEGSTFHMYFPLADASIVTKPAVVHTTSSSRGNGEHVLYVDDDPVMLLMVEALLQRWGYRVTSVADPLDAIARVHDQPEDFDVVVTDFNMPVLSGLDLAIELGRVRASLPVIISSGYVTDTMRADIQRAGVRHVLQKEFTLEQLADAVHRALVASPAVDELMPTGA